LNKKRREKRQKMGRGKKKCKDNYNRERDWDRIKRQHNRGMKEGYERINGKK